MVHLVDKDDGSCIWSVGNRHHGSTRKHLAEAKRRRSITNERTISVRPPPDVSSVTGFLRWLRDRKVHDLLGVAVARNCASSRVEDLLRRTDSAHAAFRLRRLREKDETSYSICVLIMLTPAGVSGQFWGLVGFSDAKRCERDSALIE